MTILSKSEYIAKINGLLPDNSTQQISPEDLRESLVDLIDSVHLFLDGNEITSANFASPDFRTTRGGDWALGKMSLANRLSIDNTAYGYYALGANYVSSGNTAIGSYALGCNLQGTHNVAVGYNAVAGNVNGSGNVGIGNFSLMTNKHGDFNIAIGHGAAFYASGNENNKFFLGSYPGFDQDHTCDIELSGNKNPLLYGELDNLRLGVAVPSTHADGGTLQVSGDITPLWSGVNNIGTSKYSWGSINEVVHFSGGENGPFVGINTASPSGAQGIMTVQGHVVPVEDSIYSLGHRELKWDGWFNDVVISGQLHANDVNYNHINECLYDCKTLHLATSGFCNNDDLGFHNDAICGYLSDEAIDGGGFEIHSSGSDYQRDYKFLFKFPDSTIKSCALEVDDHYSRARWQSNISLEVVSGRHVQTERVLGPRDKLSLVTHSGCFGIGIRTDFLDSGNHLGFGSMEIIDSGYCNKDIDFLSPSGDYLLTDGNPSGHDLSVLFGSVDSGVQISNQFASRIKSCNTLRGFSWVYHDEIDKLASNCDDSNSALASIPLPG